MEFLKYEPEKFFALADIIAAAPKGMAKEVAALVTEIGAELEKDLDAITDAVNAMNEENRAASKEENRFKPVLELQEEKAAAAPTAAGFLWVCHAVIKELAGLFRVLGGTAAALSPPDIRRIPITEQELGTYEGMQKLHLMVDVNGPAMNRYFGLAFAAEGAERHVVQCVKDIVVAMDPFYRTLLKRHSDEGIEIASTPVLTDVALTLFKNIDLNGELEGGTDPGQISAYTVRRGQVVARALHDDPMGMFVRSSRFGGEDIISFVTDHARKAWAVAQKISSAAKAVLPEVKKYLEPTQHHRPATVNELDLALLNLRDLDPNLVRYRDRSAVLSPEERFQTRFTNETVRGIVDMILRENADPASVVEYVVRRKSELNRHNRDENSFYVCRIGAGNKLKEKAPGELEVVPGERPKVNLAEVRGSGYDDVRSFAATIESSEEFHDVFVATSPSKTADKSNVLLIGPPGCGKSQVMRGIGAERGSIAVFAQGSDFLTCWQGEAEKNPKRLFLAAVKLRQESKRHVHLLLDEADSVLRKPEDRKTTDVDLTLEFQILLDGVVNYPGITLWGATNSPGKIPMALIRRFNKVLIVGELSLEDRAKLLETFCRALPTVGFDDRTWARLAERLDGATGDVVRKTVDHVWRFCVDGYVSKHPEEARALARWLHSTGKDGTGFDVAGFTAAQFAELGDRMRKHAQVLPKDLEASIEAHLKNPAVRAEIETAKATYKEARELTADLGRSSIILSA